MLSATKAGFVARQRVVDLASALPPVTLTLPRMARLRVEVVSTATRKPLPLAMVILDPGVPEELDDGFPHERYLTSDHDGTLAAWVMPGGEGGWEVHLDGFSSRAERLRFSPDVLGETQVIRLEPAHRLIGVVRGPDSLPSQARCSAFSSLPPRRP